MNGDGPVLALSGGIGGARLAVGLAAALPPGRLSVAANTGDDFEHLGFRVSPDIDTLLYTLSGVANTETGWGRAEETWSFLDELDRLGMDTWFRIGDKDLAVHVYRTNALRAGHSLTAITSQLAAKFGTSAAIIPMTDDRVRTVLETDDGRLDFQDYFVRHRCEPRVSRISFDGAERAVPAAPLAALLQDEALAGIVICPSNPFLSIDPILSLPGIRDALAAAAAPVVAITPIVGGDAIKGPTAKLMRERGLAVSPLAVAEHYAGLLDGFVLDIADEALAAAIASGGLAVEVANTVMRSLDDRVALARTALDLLSSLRNDALPSTNR